MIPIKKLRKLHKQYLTESESESGEYIDFTDWLFKCKRKEGYSVFESLRDICKFQSLKDTIEAFNEIVYEVREQEKKNEELYTKKEIIQIIKIFTQAHPLQRGIQFINNEIEEWVNKNVKKP